MSAHVSIKQRRQPGLSYRAQYGFSLVSAIFLLVVLAAMGAAMLNIFTVHQVSSAMDVQGARAYQAARAGIEWGLYRQLRQQRCSAIPISFALPATSSLSGFTVSVTCQLAGTWDGGGALSATPVPSTLVMGSPNATGVDTKTLVAGMSVAGDGIDPAVDTRISSITGLTTLTLTKPATGSAAQVTYYRSPLDRWVITAVACNQPLGNACPDVVTSNNPDYVQRVMQVQF